MVVVAVVVTVTAVDYRRHSHNNSQSVGAIQGLGRGCAPDLRVENVLSSFGYYQQGSEDHKTSILVWLVGVGRLSAARRGIDLAPVCTTKHLEVEPWNAGRKSWRSSRFTHSCCCSTGCALKQRGGASHSSSRGQACGKSDGRRHAGRRNDGLTVVLSSQS